jgi:PAS domain-containing protein
MLTEKEKISLYEKISSLEETKSTFNFLLENTTDYIYFKDRNGHFTFASNSFAALTMIWFNCIGHFDKGKYPS